MMINFGQTSKNENEKCKRLSEKSHNYSHCRQEKCFSLSLYPNMMMMVMVMMMPRLVVCCWRWWWWDYQCENDDDGDVDCLWGDGWFLCWFLSYKIHKSCVLELVMVMVMMMPRFVGFLPIKSTNLVVSEEMVQYNMICCFVLLYFGDRL